MTNEKRYTMDDLNKAVEAGKKLIIDRGHNNPSPETRERLVKLETKQNDIMEEIQELKRMIEKLSDKVDKAIETKADKSVVKEISNDVENLKNWKWKVMGMGIVIVAVFYIIKDYILSRI